MYIDYNFLLNYTVVSTGSFDLSSNILFNYFKRKQKIIFFKFLMNLYFIKLLISKKVDLEKIERLIAFYFISQNNKREKICFFDFFCFFIMKILKNYENFLKFYFFKIFWYIIIFIHDNVIIQKNFFFTCLSILSLNFFSTFCKKEYNFLNIFMRFQHSGTKKDFANRILINISRFIKKLVSNKFIYNTLKVSKYTFGFFFRKNNQLILFFKNNANINLISLNKKQKELLFIYKKNINKIIQKSLVSIFSYLIYKCKLIVKQKTNIFSIYKYNRFTKKKKIVNLIIKFYFRKNLENNLKTGFICKFPYFYNIKKIMVKKPPDSCIIRKTNFNCNHNYVFFPKLSFNFKSLDFKISDLKYENKPLIILIRNQFEDFKFFFLIWINISFDWFYDLLYKKKKNIFNLNKYLPVRNFILLNYYLKILYTIGKRKKFFIIILTLFLKIIYYKIDFYFTGFYVKFFIIDYFFSCLGYNFEIQHKYFKIKKCYFIFITKRNLFFSNFINNELRNYKNNFIFWNSVLKNILLKNIKCLVAFQFTILKNFIEKKYHKFLFSIKFCIKEILKLKKISIKFVYNGIFSKLNNFKFLIKLLFCIIFDFNSLYKSKDYNPFCIFNWFDINSNLIGKYFYFNNLCSFLNCLNTTSALCWLPFFKNLYTSFLWSDFIFEILIFLLFTLVGTKIFARIKTNIFNFFIISVNFLNEFIIYLFYWKKISIYILNFYHFIFLFNLKNFLNIKYRKTIISISLKSKKNLNKYYIFCWKNYFNYLNK
jgi:hypothetical protein